VSAISALWKLKTRHVRPCADLATIILIVIRILRHPGVLKRPTDHEGDTSSSISFTMPRIGKGLAMSPVFCLTDHATDAALPSARRAIGEQ
jgi:hypothetical protein